MPLRSLKRSSRCGARMVGVRAESADTKFALASAGTDPTGGAGITEVSDAEAPHNFWTVGETGWVRSLAWNSERKIGSVGGEVLVADDADAMVTGVTVRASGKLDR